MYQLSSVTRKKLMGAYLCMLLTLQERDTRLWYYNQDTDVFIMSLAFHDKIGAPLFQKCGTKSRRRVVDIRKVVATVGIDVCRALIGMHAYTGCDTVSAELLDKLEAFTCLLYAPSASSTKINDLRYHLFCAKKGEIESHQPLCKDCLVNHALRANYQAGI